jgi:hypothetical protein
MPIKPCKLASGKKGFQYGDNGKCYADRGKAVRQAAAIKASQKSKGRGHA